MKIKPLFEIPQQEIKKDELPQALDQAISLEVATIPTYLNTYYSIKRSWAQKPGLKMPELKQENYDKMLKADQRISTKTKTNPHPNPNGLSTAAGLQFFIHANGNVSEKRAKELAIAIQVYANKAAALIMSVAVEEMLHTALSSNVKQALFGPPDLLAAIPSFPTHLPGHEPYVPIHATKFSQKQLLTFLRIESPEAFKGRNVDYKKEIKNNSIGEFYKMMKRCIRKHYRAAKYWDNDRPQLLPGKGFYGPNSIDTVYYDKNHNPQFPSEDDSGDLRHVKNWLTALAAMDEVIEQGEGNSKNGDHLDEQGNPICPNIDWNDPSQINPKDFDDPSKKELSHFDKFLQLYCQGEQLIDKFAKIGLDFYQFFVFNFPDNPTNQPRKHKLPYVNYAESKLVSPIVKDRLNPNKIDTSTKLLIDVSNVINAINTYLFLMVQSCYYQKGHTQYEVFMFGVHKGMIWALSVLCYTMSQYKIEYKGEVYSTAPTWEFYDFSKSKALPKKQIQDLINKLPNIKNHPFNIHWVSEYVDVFPNVTLKNQVLAVV